MNFEIILLVNYNSVLLTILLHFTFYTNNLIVCFFFLLFYMEELQQQQQLINNLEQVEVSQERRIEDLERQKSRIRGKLHECGL